MGNNKWPNFKPKTEATENADWLFRDAITSNKYSSMFYRFFSKRMQIL